MSDRTSTTTTTLVTMVSASTTTLASFSDSQVEPMDPVRAAVIVLLAAVLSVATIAGNLMVMISFKLDKQLQTITNYFLFSLAVADMIIGAISMPLFTLFLVQRQWTLGQVVCDAWLSIDYLASNASVLNLLVISFDRYFSVTRPLTYRVRRTTRKAALMIFSAWAISAAIWPPWIIAWPHIEGERTVPDNDCYIQFIYSNEFMSIFNQCIAFYVPVVVMIGLYLRVWWATVKRQRELVNLQAGKKATSKRSNSSDETAEEGGGHVGQVRHRDTSDRMSRSSTHVDESGGWLALCCVATARAATEGHPDLLEASSENCGYATPRSADTPVCAAPRPAAGGGGGGIRDPYACRGGDFRRGLLEKRGHDEDIYTILIRLPEPSRVGGGSPKGPSRAPSIQMMEEQQQRAITLGPNKKTQGSSMPVIRRYDSMDGSTLGPSRPLSSSSSRRPSSHRSRGLLTRTYSTTTENVGGSGNVVSLSASRAPLYCSYPNVSQHKILGTSSSSAPKKASSEKKQERKAAKTLSAILLAFIITWTPYSVLVVVNAVLGKESADAAIPEYVWQFSYYLCYINSTINPVLYALCNAAFRRTYLRILTCRWSARARMPRVQRNFYG